MGLLGKPQGIFRLDDSDHWVGSFIRKEDVKEILLVNDDDLKAVKFKEVDGEDVIDENNLHKLWHKGEIPNAVPVGPHQRSLDELVLARVIKRAFPKAKIEYQVEVPTERKKHIDLKVCVPGRDPLFIEFDGPYHFIPFRPGQSLPDPFRRKHEIEKETGIEAVNWPYWIDPSERNVRSLYDNSISGTGSLFSTNAHFGDFVFDDAASVIEKMTARFRAAGPDGYGYLYDANTCGRHKPEHPIVEEIIAGSKTKNRLIPNGAKDESRWLPTRLRS